MICQIGPNRRHQRLPVIQISSENTVAFHPCCEPERRTYRHVEGHGARRIRCEGNRNHFRSSSPDHPCCGHRLLHENCRATEHGGSRLLRIRVHYGLSWRACCLRLDQSCPHRDSGAGRRDHLPRYGDRACRARQAHACPQHWPTDPPPMAGCSMPTESRPTTPQRRPCRFR
jgi:hypothetical protein